MDVFEDEGDGLSQLLDQGRRDQPRLVAGRDPCRQLAPGLARDVDDRAERRGRGQVLAGSVEDPPLHARGERAHERGLPGARLAADEDEPATVSTGLVEPREQVLALEERVRGAAHPAGAGRRSSPVSSEAMRAAS